MLTSDKMASNNQEIGFLMDIRCRRCDEVKNEKKFKKVKYTENGRSHVCRECYINNPVGRGFKYPDTIEKHRYKIKGRKYSLEHRLAISNGQKKCVKEGRHPLTKHGKGSTQRQSIDYKIWKYKVFERDENKCVICGSKDRLHAHHIKCYYDYPELRFCVDNGKCLCISCHASYHKKIRGINNPEKRICSVCSVEKKINDFTKNGKWYRHTCKQCRSDKNKR